jgi:hypothetical protein
MNSVIWFGKHEIRTATMDTMIILMYQFLNLDKDSKIPGNDKAQIR